MFTYSTLIAQEAAELQRQNKPLPKTEEEMKGLLEKVLRGSDPIKGAQ